AGELGFIPLGWPRSPAKLRNERFEAIDREFSHRLALRRQHYAVIEGLQKSRQRLDDDTGIMASQHLNQVHEDPDRRIPFLRQSPRVVQKSEALFGGQAWQRAAESLVESLIITGPV